MKSVSIEEAIARIEKDLEENEIAEEGVIRAVPTGPATPIISNDSGITTLQSPVGPVFDPPTFGDNNQPLTLEELIERLNSETEESLYQKLIEGYTAHFGEPSDTIIELARTCAALNYHHCQSRLRVLKYLQNRPPTETCPIERDQLDCYGELFEVSREADEPDEAYHERIRQRAFPHPS